MSKIKIKSLGVEIAKGLEEYNDEIVALINTESQRVAKAAVKQLKETSPKRPGRGYYADSWKVKTDYKTGLPDSRIVHVEAPNYRLTHLLEYGHATVNGDRTRAFPHIAPAEEMVIREFTAAIEEALKK